MRKRGHDQARATKEIGCGGGVVSRWLYCDTCPAAAWLTRIEEKYGVPANAWGKKPSKRFRLPGEAAA